MRLVELDRYLNDRALVLWIGPPYYRAALAFAEAPDDYVVVAEGSSVEQSVKGLIAGADVAQRQRGERWAVRPNPVMTLASVDRWLEEYDLMLNLRPDAAAEVRYGAWVESGEGLVTHPVAARSITRALGELVVETPRLVEPLESIGVFRAEEPPKGEIGPLEIEAALEAHGSVNAAAKALGVPRSTLRGWIGHMKRPEEPEREAIGREEIEEALDAAGSVTGAAEIIGIPRSTLRYWIDRYGVETPRRRQREGVRLPRHVLSLEEATREIELAGGDVREAAERLGVPYGELRAFLERRAPPPEVPSLPSSLPRRSGGAVSAEEIRQAMEQTRSVSAAARRLGVSRKRLARYLEERAG